MDEQSRAAWQAVIRKKLRGEDVPSEEINALAPQDLLKGLGKAAAEEEARYFVRYWFGGEDLSDTPPQGISEGHNWFAILEQWGPERQEEKLRNMIDASEQNPDYWDALTYIEVQLLCARIPWPDILADWELEVRMGLRSKPPARGNRGQPPYAKDRRNGWIAGAFFCLGYLGMGKMESYRLIADELGMSRRTVMNAIRSNRKRSDSLLQPWECWSQWR